MDKKIDSIAIDGVAGVGKSTIAKMLAEKLGWKTLETGAIYRAITASLLAKNYDVKDEDFVGNIAHNLFIEVKYLKGVQHVLVDGMDLTAYLRGAAVENNVPFVAKVPQVREKVRAVQRQIAESENIVVEGRDIGTVVLPNSQNKIFLTADPKVRATRRFKQLCAKGQKPSMRKIYADILKRDELDRTRAISPLVPADDAFVVDTSDMQATEVVDLILTKIKTIQKNYGAER